MSSSLSSPLRLPLLDPEGLSEPQQQLYDRLTDITKNKYGDCFITKDVDGRFIGPFGIVMHSPALGERFYDISAEVGKLSNLPARTREIAILAVGAQFGAEYETYAHTKVGHAAGLRENQIKSLVQGLESDEMEDDEGVAWEVAVALTSTSTGSRGPLRVQLWDKAVAAFGVDGAIALVHIVGFYAYTCIILNAFDARAPV